MKKTETHGKHHWVRVGYVCAGCPDMFYETVSSCTFNDALKTTLLGLIEKGKEVHTIHIISYAG